MQNNAMYANNNQPTNYNDGQNSSYGEQPIRVETIVYGTPSKTNPDVYEDFTVETKMWMPDGQEFTESKPMTQGFAPQQTVPHQAVPQSVYEQDPMPYTSPNRASGNYYEQDLRNKNFQPAVYNQPSGQTKVYTRVLDAPQERPYNYNEQPQDQYQQPQINENNQNRQNGQPIAISVTNKVSYEFPTFDPHRIPQFKPDNQINHQATFQPQREPQPTYASPSRSVNPQHHQNYYVANPYQPVIDTQGYTTVPVQQSTPNYISPVRTSQPLYQGQQQKQFYPAQQNPNNNYYAKGYNQDPNYY